MLIWCSRCYSLIIITAFCSLFYHVTQYSLSFFVNTQNWSVINTNSTNSFLELLRHSCVILLSRYILGYLHISLSFSCINLEQSTEFRLPPLFIGKHPAVRSKTHYINRLYFLISKLAFLIITRTKARISGNLRRRRWYYSVMASESEKQITDSPTTESPQQITRMY